MAKKFYIQYTPVRAGISGSEFLAPFLDEHFNGITYHGIISDDMNHYGYLEGTGDLLSKALMAIESRFSIRKLSEKDIIGIAKVNYNPTPIVIDGTTQTFIEFMDSHGITIHNQNQVVNAVKKMKKTLFKEITKKQFDDYNELISDLTKVMVLFNHHYNDLDSTAKIDVDLKVETLKSIYDQTSCLDAFDRMIENIQTILTSYYAATTEIDNAETIEDLEIIEYDD